MYAPRADARRERGKLEARFSCVARATDGGDRPSSSSARRGGDAGVIHVPPSMRALRMRARARRASPIGGARVCARWAALSSTHSRQQRETERAAAVQCRTQWRGFVRSTVELLRGTLSQMAPPICARRRFALTSDAAHCYGARHGQVVRPCSAWRDILVNGAYKYVHLPCLEAPPAQFPGCGGACSTHARSASPGPLRTRTGRAHFAGHASQMMPYKDMYAAALCARP